MNRITAAIAAAIILSATPVAVSAAPCKDAKGKFIKCPPKAEPVKKGPCKDAKGKFTKCK